MNRTASFRVMIPSTLKAGFLQDFLLALQCKYETGVASIALRSSEHLPLDDGNTWQGGAASEKGL